MNNGKMIGVVRKFTQQGEQMNKDTRNLKEVCPICKGTGFYNGKLCHCITGKWDDNIFDAFADLFGKNPFSPNAKKE